MTNEKTLRDEFAMAAAPACFSEVMDKYIWGQWDSVYLEVATMSYGIADAMLEARKEKSQEVKKETLSHERKHYDSQGYCDNPARGY